MANIVTTDFLPVELTESLTDKQLAFCFEYAIDFNGSQAAQRAGYSPDSARFIARDLLKKPEVQEVIRAILKEIQFDRIMSAEEVMFQLTQMARGDATEEMVFPSRFGDTTVSSKRQIIPKDRLKALELIGKRYAMFVDKQEVDEKTTFVVDIEGLTD